MNTPYFKLTPISDPPKEDGNYPIWLEDGQNWGLQYFSVKHGFINLLKDDPWYWIAPLAEPVEGMRWVKASERLPVLNNQRSREFCCRWTDNMGSNRFVQTYTEKHGFCISEGNLPYLEWLDESASSTPHTEPVEGMRWVKASERLPGQYTPSVKWRDAETNKEISSVAAASALRMGMSNIIEWYDSSSTPSAREAELEREVAELKQLMEKKLRRAYTRGWVAKHQQQTRGKQESTEDEEIKAIMEWDGIDKPSPFQNR